MVASDDRLPHQIFTRGKMNNAIKTLSSTQLQLRTKHYLQKTSSSNYWKINIQQLSNPILQQLLTPDLLHTKRFYKWNRKQLKNLSPFCLNDQGASEKTWLHITEDNDHCRYRILIRPLKPRSSLRFSLATDPTLTKSCRPLQSFFKVWPCWPQRHFERPQLFHPDTEVIAKQGFNVLWWW